MASRHYGKIAYILHVWGEYAWQHEWKVYGTESQAHVQGTRMVREGYWSGSKGKVQYEVLPLTGQGLPNPHVDEVDK